MTHNVINLHGPDPETIERIEKIKELALSGQMAALACVVVLDDGISFIMDVTESSSLELLGALDILKHEIISTDD